MARKAQSGGLEEERYGHALRVRRDHGREQEARAAGRARRHSQPRTAQLRGAFPARLTTPSEGRESGSARCRQTLPFRSFSSGQWRYRRSSTVTGSD